jgi:hypothetical protein
MERKPAATKTKVREKYAVWLDRSALKRLRPYSDKVGLSVSELIRTAVNRFIELHAKK